jgi:hypothetical protein
MNHFARRGLDGLELDLASAVARLRQLRDEGWDAGLLELNPFGALLLERVLTCDLPRLEQHITPRAAALLDEVTRARG